MRYVATFILGLVLGFVFEQYEHRPNVLPDLKPGQVYLHPSGATIEILKPGSECK